MVKKIKPVILYGSIAAVIAGIVILVLVYSPTSIPGINNTTSTTTTTTSSLNVVSTTTLNVVGAENYKCTQTVSAPTLINQTGTTAYVKFTVTFTIAKPAAYESYYTAPEGYMGSVVRIRITSNPYMIRMYEFQKCRLMPATSLTGYNATIAPWTGTTTTSTVADIAGSNIVFSQTVTVKVAHL